MAGAAQRVPLLHRADDGEGRRRPVQQAGTARRVLRPGRHLEPQEAEEAAQRVRGAVGQQHLGAVRPHPHRRPPLAREPREEPHGVTGQHETQHRRRRAAAAGHPQHGLPQLVAAQQHGRVPHDAAARGESPRQRLLHGRRAAQLRRLHRPAGRSNAPRAPPPIGAGGFNSAANRKREGGA